MVQVLDDGIQVISLSGSLLKADTEKIDQVLKDTEGSIPRVIIDFSSTNHICSSVLGLLVSYKKKFLSDTGDIKLVIQDEDLLQLFEITMLDKIFKIFPDVDTAKKSYL